ncbi:MAG: polysaccharide biosynthesis/export family protein [Pyrinomonadaceae bacterium]
MAAISASAQIDTLGGQSEATANRNQYYQIGPGDVIDVVVSQNAMLSRTGIRVNNQGLVQLPMLDEEVAAACRTERELAEQIKEKYKKYLLNPYVIVAVQQFNSTPAAMIGAVKSPGRFQMQRPVKMLELLTLVNGPSEKAGNNIEIIRNRSLPYCDGSNLVVAEGVDDELISINLADTMKGVEGSNPYVQAGDIIRVGEADQTRAYITGSVKSSTVINLNEPVTLTQAIAMAGGLASGAQSEKILIRRQIEGSVNRTELFVNLKEINQRKKDDILLRPNDLIEVAGPGKISSFLQTLIPSLTQLPIRVIPIP